LPVPLKETLPEHAIECVPLSTRTLAPWRWRLFWLGCALPFSFWPFLAQALRPDLMSLGALAIFVFCVASFAAHLGSQHAYLGLGLGGSTWLVFGPFFGRFLAELRWIFSLLWILLWLNHFLFWGERLLDASGSGVTSLHYGELVPVLFVLCLGLIAHRIARGGLGKVFRAFMPLFFLVLILLIGLFVFTLRIGMQRDLLGADLLNDGGTGMAWQGFAFLMIGSLPLWLSSLEWNKFYGEGLHQEQNKVSPSFWRCFPLGFCLFALLSFFCLLVLHGVAKPGEKAFLGSLVAETAAFGGVIGGSVTLALEFAAFFLLVPLHGFFAPQSGLKTFTRGSIRHRQRLMISVVSLVLIFICVTWWHLWPVLNTIFLLSGLWIFQCLGLVTMALRGRFITRYAQIDDEKSLIAVQQTEINVVRRSACLIALCLLVLDLLLLFAGEELVFATWSLDVALLFGLFGGAGVFWLLTNIFLQATKVHIAKRSTEIVAERIEEEPTEGRTDPGFYFNETDKLNKDE
jgi:hypothetical protein